jgi:hypothetical protein
VRELTRFLARGLGEEYVVQVQDTVAVAGWEGNEAPEVDVAILRDKTFHTGPTAADALALIEISDTTYAVDRRYKIPLYVATGVPSYIVNIPLRQVEYYGALQDLESEHGRVFAERDTFEILKVVVPISVLFSS